MKQKGCAKTDLCNSYSSAYSCRGDDVLIHQFLSLVRLNPLFFVKIVAYFFCVFLFPTLIHIDYVLC